MGLPDHLRRGPGGLLPRLGDLGQRDRPQLLLPVRRPQGPHRRGDGLRVLLGDGSRDARDARHGLGLRRVRSLAGLPGPRRAADGRQRPLHPRGARPGASGRPGRLFISVLLLNPAAGHGRAARRWDAARPAVEAALGPLRVLKSERRGHGVELVRQALESGAKRVYAFGGDGTWHEAVGGYFAAGEAARSGAALAPLPAGSGCDFARHLGLPLDPVAAARALAGAPVRGIDAVRADLPGGTARYLTNMAGTGLAADAAEVVDRWGKPLGGTLSYLVATLAMLLTRPARRYRLTLDGKDASGLYHAVLLANTETTGGGMRAAPGADLEDGALDVLTVESSGRLALAARLAKLYDGTHVGTPGVGLRRARKVSLALDGPGTAGLNLDGEPSGALPADFTVLPRALPVLWRGRRDS
ncbi:hypothetical protein EPO15_17625 [bacterium]|nr:MAG: hypothetical protein EPO15_17625 [bacterium]